MDLKKTIPEVMLKGVFTFSTKLSVNNIELVR